MVNDAALRASASSASRRRASSASAAAGSTTASARRPSTRNALASCSPPARAGTTRRTGTRRPPSPGGRRRRPRRRGLVGAKLAGGQRGGAPARGPPARPPAGRSDAPGPGRTAWCWPASSSCSWHPSRGPSPPSRHGAGPASSARRAARGPGSAAPARHPHRSRPLTTTALRRKPTGSSRKRCARAVTRCGSRCWRADMPPPSRPSPTTARLHRKPCGQGPSGSSCGRFLARNRVIHLRW